MSIRGFRDAHKLFLWKYAIKSLLSWGISSAGRALRWQRRGQRFDPAMLHQDTISYNLIKSFILSYKRSLSLDKTLITASMKSEKNAPVFLDDDIELEVPTFIKF